MISWLNAHRRAAADARERLREGAGGSLLTVVALAVVLLLPALGHWLVDGIERAGSRLAAPGEVSLWLSDKAGNSERQAIEARLAEANVTRWRFVSRDAALEALKSVDGLAEVAAGLEDNPLPDAYLVEPRAADAAGLAAFAETARGWPGVAEAHADLDWASRIEALVGAARKALWLLTAILAVALVAVSFNTIRLQVAGRQAEIEIALLIGATPAWAARPFLWLGALEGLIAGCLASAGLYLIHAAAGPVLAELAAFVGDASAMAAPSATLAGGLIGGATAIGWAGARVSVARIGR